MQIIRYILRQCMQKPSVRLQSTCAPATDLDACFRLICELCMQGGEHMYAALKQRKRAYTIKGLSRDIVTKTDLLIENLITCGIRQEFPHHKFIGEETVAATKHGNKLTDAPTWIIDPIDGTMNFVHGFPFTCISVALYVQQINEVAIVYNPLYKHCYTARRGQGAMLNGKQIKVSGVQDLSKALVLQELGRASNAVTAFRNMEILIQRAHAVRTSGSSVLNMVMIAQGVADAYSHFGIHVWDMAAGDLIVREAGGVVIDPCGGEYDLMSRRVLAAATPALACALVDLLVQSYPKPRDDEPKE